MLVFHSRGLQKNAFSIHSFLKQGEINDFMLRQRVRFITKEEQMGYIGAEGSRGYFWFGTSMAGWR